MAVITVSATGGNFNATGTWVGGVIPTSADDIVGAVTSGQLTINVASSVRSMDFTNYTNTITFTNTLTLVGTSLTHNLGGVSTNYAGTSGILSSTIATFAQNNTNRIPLLQFSTNSKTLNTNLYCTRYNVTSSIAINNNTIYVNGSFGDFTQSVLNNSPTLGSTSYVLDGSGLINFNYAGTGSITINTVGEYNTFSRGLTIGTSGGANTPTFNFTAGATPTLFNLILQKTTSQPDNYNININAPINLFIQGYAVNGTGTPRNITLNTTSGINCGLFSVFNEPRTFTTDTAPADIRIVGGALTVTTLNLFPTFRTTSSQTNPPVAGSFTLKGATLRLDPLYTHNITRMKLSGGGIPDRPVIRSTSGTQVPIILGDRTTSQIVDYDFTDINASGGQQILAIGGTITNSTNVTNIYPTSTGGGSFTFVN